MASKSGFTLIELLITITIIAILSAIALVSYTSFMKNSRDAKRQSDLKFIQSALEQYFADQKHYPFQVIPDRSITSGGRTYMTKVPSDPSGSPNYLYEEKGTNCAELTPANCTNYCLKSHLENLSSPKTEDTLNCPTTDTYNYVVTKP